MLFLPPGKRASPLSTLRSPSPFAQVRSRVWVSPPVSEPLGARLTKETILNLKGFRKVRETVRVTPLLLRSASSRVFDLLSFSATDNKNSDTIITEAPERLPPSAGASAFVPLRTLQTTRAHLEPTAPIFLLFSESLTR